MGKEDSFLDESKDDELSKTHESGDGRSLLTEEYYKLPPVVKRRVKALKKLQYETLKLEAAYQRELFELELKYQPDHDKIFEQRKAFINGDREPTTEECDWPSDTDEVENLSEEMKEKVDVSKESNGTTTEINGIPEFWSKTMRSIFLLDDMIKENDLPVLKHLVDVRYTLQSGEEPGFTVEFVFSPNDYFNNQVLTKRYFLNYEISDDAPFEYEGPEIIRTKGSVINWKPGKNVTVKHIKKVQQRKGGGGKRTITKTVQEDSFFNFFDPPTEVLSQDLDEDTQLLLEADFKLGQFIRDSLIPKGVLYFTGEIAESELEDDDDDEDDDEDEFDDEEDDDEPEDDEQAHHRRRGPHNRPKSGGKGKGLDADAQPECKQQ